MGGEARYKIEKEIPGQRNYPRPPQRKQRCYRASRRCNPRFLSLIGFLLTDTEQQVENYTEDSGARYAGYTA